MLGRQRETDVNRKRSRSRKDPWEAENEKQEKESKGEGLEEPAGDGRKIGGGRHAGQEEASSRCVRLACSCRRRIGPRGLFAGGLPQGDLLPALEETYCLVWTKPRKMGVLVKE